MKKSFTIIGLMAVWGLFFLTSIVSANSYFPQVDEKKPTVVYENSSGNIIVATPQIASYQIRVYDLTGKEIFNKKVEALSNNTIVESSLLEKGLYLIRLVREGNNTPLVFKVMVQ